MGFQKQHLTEEKRQRGSPGADGDAEFVPEADSEQSGKMTSSWMLLQRISSEEETERIPKVLEHSTKKFKFLTEYLGVK